MTDKERKSCIRTIELLRRLAFNVHGVMDVIDAHNCDKIIEMLNKPEPQWIPTSKERPPQHQEIWITSDLGTVELVYGKAGVWWIDENYYTEPEIIAWMPASVPSPYQPEEESE